MTGEAGQAMAGNIGNLLAQQGAAQAGGALAGAAPFAQLAALPGQLVGLNLGMGGSLFGGGGGGRPRTLALGQEQRIGRRAILKPFNHGPTHPVHRPGPQRV
jgi:hypothetical protein